MVELTEVQHISRRLRSLKQIREPFEDVWMELSSTILGYRGVFNDNTGKTRERKIDTTIVNNTASIASTVLASGLMGGVSSPSKPWVNFVVSSIEMMESTEVRIWLEKVEKIVSMVMSKSNIYNSIHTLYTELGVFGTGALGIFEDYDKVIRTECYTAGTYYIDINQDGIVDTFYREFIMTGTDIINKFGEDKLPVGFQSSGTIDKDQVKFKIIHAIEPNKSRNMDSKLSKDKKFTSTYIYYENAGSYGDYNNQMKNGKVLMKSGYDEFPIMVARWDVIPGDVYGGMCPGIRSIGDTKMLQSVEDLVYTGIEKQVNPALVTGPSIGNIPDDGVQAGDIIEVDNLSEAGARSVYDVRIDVSHAVANIEKIEFRIKTAFYENLFLQMLSSDRREMTASEVDVRSNEALITLGPVLTRLHNELLDPLTDRVFNIIARAELLPDAPDELSGHELQVEYVSTLAKAQKADVSQTIERTAAFVAGLSEAFPNARHKFDELQAIDEFSKAESVPPKIIRSNEVASQLIQQEQQQMKQQEQQQMMLEAAKVAPGVIKSGAEASQMEGEQ